MMCLSMPFIQQRVSVAVDRMVAKLEKCCSLSASHNGSFHILGLLLFDQNPHKGLNGSKRKALWKSNFVLRPQSEDKDTTEETADINIKFHKLKLCCKRNRKMSELDNAHYLLSQLYKYLLYIRYIVILIYTFDTLDLIVDTYSIGNQS